MSREPTRPGELFVEGWSEELKDLRAVAEKMGISTQMLRRLLNGRHRVDMDMAIRLFRFTGTAPGVWLRLQLAHDIWEAEQRDLSLVVA
jgi:addiction module HigA family antidote